MKTRSSFISCKDQRGTPFNVFFSSSEVERNASIAAVKNIVHRSLTGNRPPQSY